MTLQNIRHILQQAKDLGTVKSIYFEGGEPFLYYPIMLRGVQEAASAGFRVGLVTNGYWATETEDALEWLRPFVGLIGDVSISSDSYHWTEKLSQ
jgi:MoaA/NifB/PqqE/SkfB family radical SAM enzyme